MSYYRQKDVIDGLARRINEGMSKRVKEDAAFANTRLNAAEFGSAGSFAGAAVRSITLRWRTILQPFTTGKLVPDILDFIKSDTTNPWGQRTFTNSDWKPVLLDMLSRYAKNQYQGNYANIDYLGVSQGVQGGAPFNVNVNLESDPVNVSWLISKGVDSIRYQFYRYRLTKGQYQAASGKYLPSYSSVSFLQSSDAPLTSSETDEFVLPTGIAPVSDTDVLQFTGLLVVALPIRTVGNTSHVMQELASFQLLKDSLIIK